jgi:hypothetical protein
MNYFPFTLFYPSENEYTPCGKRYFINLMYIRGTNSSSRYNNAKRFM